MFITFVPPQVLHDVPPWLQGRVVGVDRGSAFCADHFVADLLTAEVPITLQGVQFLAQVFLRAQAFAPCWVAAALQLKRLRALTSRTVKDLC